VNFCIRNKNFITKEWRFLEKGSNFSSIAREY